MVGFEHVSHQTNGFAVVVLAPARLQLRAGAKGFLPQRVSGAEVMQLGTRAFARRGGTAYLMRQIVGRSRNGAHIMATNRPGDLACPFVSGSQRSRRPWKRPVRRTGGARSASHATCQ